jgi:histidinol-phosphate aminotransferase
MMDWKRLLRPDIAALEPYTPVAPLEVLAERLGLPAHRLIKLDANENPYGPSPLAQAALKKLADSPATIAIYPDPEHTHLRAAISGYVDQPAERIMCGAGSDELIDLLMRLTLAAGDSIVDCQPTFPMYAFNAGLQAAQVVDIPRDANFELDLEGIAEAAERGSKLIFLAAPNNPTGNPLPRQAIARLLELPMLVVIDEAYAEFAGESAAELVGSAPNLVVLRTFSKWAGLAGLRIGYALAHEELLAQLWKIKQPYNVNVAAEAAAIASLQDVDYLMANVASIVTERERMAAALTELPGMHVYPSRANFLLCRLSERGPTAGLELRDALRRRGILVRAYNRAGLRDCTRFSIGTPEQNAAMLAAVAEELETLGAPERTAEP